MLYHLSFMHIPDMPCPGRHDNVLESLPFSLLQHLLCLERVLLSEGALFKYKQTNPGSTLPTNFLFRLSHFRPLFTCLLAPGPGIQQWGTAPGPMTNPKPAVSASIPSQRNHKGSCTQFPTFHHDQPQCLPRWSLMACPLPLGTGKNYLYNENHVLIC